MACSTSTRSWTDLATSGFDGAVSLEVDLRPSLGHPEKLEATMVGMRERTELALASAGRAAR